MVLAESRQYKLKNNQNMDKTKKQKKNKQLRYSSVLQLEDIAIKVFSKFEYQ